MEVFEDTYTFVSVSKGRIVSVPAQVEEGEKFTAVFRGGAEERERKVRFINSTEGCVAVVFYGQTINKLRLDFKIDAHI